jgi:hypothetical protein
VQLRLQLDDTLTARIQVMNQATTPPTPLSGIGVTFQLATPDRVVVRALNARADQPIQVFTDSFGQAVLEFTAPVGDWVLIATATAYNGTAYVVTSNSFRVLPALVPDRVSLTPAKATVPCGLPVVLTARVLSNTSEPVRRTPVTFGLSGSCMNAVLVDGRVNKAGSKTVVTNDEGLAIIWLFNEGEPGSVAVVGVISNGVAAIMSQPAHITFVEQEAEEEAYAKEERPPHPYYEDKQQHAAHQPEDKEEAQRPSSHDTQHPQRPQAAEEAPEQAPVQAPEEHDRQRVQQREPLREAPLQQREALREAPLQQREALREAPPLEQQAPPQQQRNQPQQKPQRNAGQEQQTAQPRKRTTVALQSQQPVAMPQRARAGELAHPMAAQQPLA